MHKHIPLLLNLVCALCLTAGCRTAGDNEGELAQVAEPPERVWIEPVRSMIGVTGRSVLSCPDGKCVVLHYPPMEVDTGDLSQFLTRAPNSPQFAAELYDNPNDRWCQTGASHRATNTFNCCTYAVGDVVGLTRHDWITPSPMGDTFYTVPMQVILDSYFDRIRTYRRPIRDWGVLEKDALLQPEDVMCCVRTSGPVPVYNHAGRICSKDGENWVISKFGVGPLVRTTIQTVAAEYTNQFDEIWVFRAKDSATPKANGKRPPQTAHRPKRATAFPLS